MPEDSTTPDLVELTHRAFEVVNRRALDALMRLYAPDSLLDTTRTIGVAPQGRAAIRGLVEDWMGAYEESAWVVEELLDLGNGVVFAVVSQKCRPVGVSGSVQQREGWVWIWVDGLMASHTTYPEADIDEARAAAEGLAESRERVSFGSRPMRRWSAALFSHRGRRAAGPAGRPIGTGARAGHCCTAVRGARTPLGPAVRSPRSGCQVCAGPLRVSPARG
jgi:ketosteroid isomerase-like protein